MSPTKALAVLVSIAAVGAAYVTFGRLTSTVPNGSIATVPVVQVDFLRTRTNLESGAVDVIYRGVRYLADAADGRMRVDRTPVDNSEEPTIHPVPADPTSARLQSRAPDRAQPLHEAGHRQRDSILLAVSKCSG